MGYSTEFLTPTSVSVTRTLSLWASLSYPQPAVAEMEKAMAGFKTEY